MNDKNVFKNVTCENGCYGIETEKNNMILKFKKIHPKAIIPEYKSTYAAAFDFHAIIEKNQMGVSDSVIFIKPKQKLIVQTGLIAVIPSGYKLDITPRSGMAFHDEITIINTPGKIDEDYFGEIKVVLYNLSDKEVKIQNGQRIAQCELRPVFRATIIETEEITEEELQKDRGGGIGSTGK